MKRARPAEVWRPDVPPTPEEAELINPPVKLAPDEGYIRFRHNTATGLGPYRRVKISDDGLEEAMRRCAKEFGQ